jgi:hypothetical protein
MNMTSMDGLLMLMTLVSAVICIALPRALTSIRSNLTRKSWAVSSDRTSQSQPEFAQAEASLN